MRSEGCAGINKAKGKLEACLSNGSNMFQLPIAEERVKSVRDWQKAFWLEWRALRVVYVGAGREIQQDWVTRAL